MLGLLSPELFQTQKEMAQLPPTHKTQFPSVSKEHKPGFTTNIHGVLKAGFPKLTLAKHPGVQRHTAACGGSETLLTYKTPCTPNSSSHQGHLTLTASTPLHTAITIQHTAFGSTHCQQGAAPTAFGGWGAFLGRHRGSSTRGTESWQ